MGATGFSSVLYAPNLVNIKRLNIFKTVLQANFSTILEKKGNELDLVLFFFGVRIKQTYLTYEYVLICADIKQGASIARPC